MDENDNLLIPASVMLKVFNEALGTDCKTMEEAETYLKQHPEAYKIFAAGPPLSKKTQ